MFLIARWVKGRLGAPEYKQLEGFLWSTTTVEVDEAVEMPLQMPIVLTDAAPSPTSSGVTLRKKVTSSSENLNIQKNGGGGMFACTYCSRSFATAGILKNHEQEHAEMMPYRCDICGKGFKHKRSQNRHHKLHSGQRKYKCTMCDSRFFRSDHLKLHMKTHEVSKYAFVCVLCQRGFNSNSALESHLQVYHSNESPAQDAIQPDVEEKVESLSPAIQVKEEEENEEGQETTLTSMTTNVEDSSQLCCGVRSVGVASSEALLAHAESAAHGLGVATGGSDLSPSVSNTERAGSVSTTAGGQYACCVLCSLSFDSSEAFEAHFEAAHHGGSGGATALSDRALLSQFNDLAATLPSLSAGATDSWPSSSTAAAYSCGFCGELKANVGDLQKHTLHKHSLKDLQLPPISADPTYDCDFCGRCFDSILALHCHASSAHRKSASAVDGSSNVQAYQCGQCDTSFSTLKMFTGHMRGQLADPGLRPSSGGRRCHLCGLVAESDDRLNSHLLTHYLQKECRQCCQACGRWFPRADELNEHMFQVHAVHAYRCSLCGSLFESRADMQRHLVAAHVDEQIRHRCRACGAAFDSGDQFLAHVRLAHTFNSSSSSGNNNNNNNCSPSPPELHYYCTVCCLAFDSEAEYRAHSHAAFQCSLLCSKSFSGQHPYEQHINNEHGLQASASDEEPQQLDNGPSSPANNNKCNICDKKCSSLVELAQHKLQHCKVVHSETCAVCRAPIGSVEQFFIHVRMHNSNTAGGVAPACIICKQSLLSTVEMHTHAKFHLRLDNASHNHWPRQQHMLSSKAEAQVQQAHVANDGLHHRCTLCQKVFISPAKLQCHLIEHSFSGGSGFQCYLCNTAFPLPQTLQQHITSVHNRPEDRPYQCSTCAGRFFFRAELDHHTLAEHGRGADTLTATPADESTLRYCFCGQSVPDLAAFQSHLSVCTAAKGGDPAAASALELLAWTAFPDDAEKVKQILALISSAMAAVVSTTTAPTAATTTELPTKTEPNSGVPLSIAAASVRQTGNKRMLLSPPAVSPKMAKLSLATCSPTLATTTTTTTTAAAAAAATTTTAATATTTTTTTTSTTTTTAAVTVTAAPAVSRTSSSQQRGSHPCPHCSKVFHSPSALQGHSHVHMGSRIHQCSKCQREFPTAAKMRNHQRQHSGDKPFPCEVCGRFFSRKDNLKVHMKTHFKYSALSSLNDLPTMVSPMSRCLYNTSIGQPATSVVELQNSSTSATNATGSDDESTSAVSLRPQQLIA
ncbi:Zinc finger protein [Trichinella pseudospiralis]|uniref:Zinc finger protein n=1 Tax=Trichinella pseudospiralis TaxID=6337 RepID=A0A0V1IF24_TRIPS|nr:Zinc finger protein [Trichinella pseudospiralis]